MISDLTIVIPARNEIFLARTIEDIVTNMEGKTEVIAICDGNWPSPPIKDHPKVNLIYHPESIGQRAAMNEAVRISKAKYILKCDAHCSFDKGFDVKLLNDMKDDWTMVPIMRNLHAFDWVCEDGHRRYQGPSGPCGICSKPTKMDIVWIAKTNPQSTSYCFDSTPHFQYFREFKERPEGKGDITETMSLQGSCWLLTRKKYRELNVCDEKFGSWGSQGIEVAAKTWLSGGKVVCNHKTWYAHLFRTQGGDFGFPYKISGKQVHHAKQRAKELFFNNQWPKQKYPLSWLVKKFWPVPGWSDIDFDKLVKNEKNVSINSECSVNPKVGVVFYTDNRIDLKLLAKSQESVKLSAKGCKIVSVSLQPLPVENNIVIPLKRSILTMFKQILAGIEACDADIIFFAEHDVFYAPEYFSFIPSDKTKIFYNLNIWQVRAKDGHAVYFDAKRTSQLCAYRDVLLEHYRKRIEKVEKDGFTRKIGFEPGSHNRPERIDDLKSETWIAKYPNLDIKHGKNLTSARWHPSEFRSQKNCRNWKEADRVPFWGNLKELLSEL